MTFNFKTLTKSSIALGLTLTAQISLASISSEFTQDIEPTRHTDPRCQGVNRAIDEHLKITFNDNEFLFEDSEFQVENKDLSLDIVIELLTLRNLLVRNGDKVLASDKPLCTGTMAGDISFNAFAVLDVAIFMGEDLMLFIQKKYGKYAPQMIKFIMFHEFAHSIQSIYDWKVNEKDKNKKSKIQEMQADCMAATFMQLRGMLNKDSQKALEHIALLTGDRTPYGDHGTAVQRFRAIVQSVKAVSQNIGDLRKMNSQYIAKNICPTSAMRDIIENDLKPADNN